MKVKTTKTVVAIVLLAALAACDSAREAPAEEEPTEADGEASGEGAKAEETVSILRPDIEQPDAAQTELEPLNVVIGFPEGGSELSDEAISALQDVVTSEQIKLGLPVIVGGHSDAGGSDAVNERASLARAEAVRDWLTENGVAESRIRVIAFGEQNPIEPNALPDGEPNESGRAANRRVEVQVQVPVSDEIEAAESEESPAE